MTKNVRKSDVGEGFAAKKCDVTHSKKTRFCEWRSFWMALMMMFYIAVFLWVYLLTVSLDFYETNKSYIIKYIFTINIYIQNKISTQLLYHSLQRE